MLICLSSGIRPRYREDILRVISMPVGSHHKFRYQLKLIPPGLLAKLKKGDHVCIAYLDRSIPSEEPHIIPCRAAKLLANHTYGDFCVLNFELQEHYIAPNSSAFNKEIREHVANLPYWKNGELCGSFCQLTNDCSLPLERTTDIEDWQKLVTSLSVREDFKSEQFYYSIRGLFEQHSRKEIIPRANVYKLVDGVAYEWRMIQFNPGDDDSKGRVGDIPWLLVDGEDKAFSFITSKKLAIDSPYDEKIVRFRPIAGTSAADSTISFYRQNSSNKSPAISDAIWDFDLTVRITPRWWTLVWQGLLVGLLIALQGTIPILTSKGIEDKPSLLVYLALACVIVLGLLTGLVASFKLRRP